MCAQLLAMVQMNRRDEYFSDKVNDCSSNDVYFDNVSDFVLISKINNVWIIAVSSVQV